MADPERRSFAPHRLFRELKWEVSKAVFVSEILNTAILFFTLNIVLTFFNISFFVSLIPAILYLIWRMFRGFRTSTVRKIEEGNPEVFEILRTAYDHQEESSLMLQGLMFDLQKKMATVSAGVLLDPKRILTKIVAIALLAFIPVMIISFTPQLIQANPLEDVDFTRFFGEESGEAFGELFGVNLNRSEDIYGDANIIELGDEKLDVFVRPGGSTVSFEEIGDPEDRTFGSNAYPTDVSVQAAESGSGGVYSEDDVQLINSYACKAKGACPQQ